VVAARLDIQMVLTKVYQELLAQVLSSVPLHRLVVVMVGG
jgi:hypothetical protein